ncbi:restriction endonuclease subunit S [Haemophilus sputorum]|uniref:restriction endonuclease subunit S n=1 Tax=Haemophilus sputorum TaxID=1078480 RepID=UPI002105A770|nr:restriction endonuclease subunit S [Haemophilus sputorum]MCQ1857714.1 restriction endonuclease subunit S [Haemophilus sputorum]
MNKQQEPCLRFNGFSGLWEEKYLDEVGDFSAGGDIKKEKLTPFGRYPVLANALTNNGIVGFYNDYEFESPAITITGRGDVGIAKARKENFSAVVRLLVLKNKPNYDVDFLEQAINKIDFHIESTGVPQLTVPQCRSYSIYLPSESEQTHLGLFFRRLDSQIAESRAVLEKSRQLKKAMLAKMFPANGEKIPKIRFKGFAGEWESRKLGIEVEIIGGGTPDTTNSAYWNGDIDWYSPTEIGEAAYANGSVKKITLLGLQKSSAQILPANRTVLFTSRASIGDMAILTRDGATNQGFQSFVVGERLDVYFLYTMGFKIKDYALKNASGSTFLEISKNTLSQMEFFAPSLKEQTAIGNFFRQLDETIALQSAEVEKLNQLKKGLLAAMLV